MKNSLRLGLVMGLVMALTITAFPAMAAHTLPVPVAQPTVNTQAADDNLTRREARRIVRRVYPGVRIERVEQEMIHGAMAWNFYLRNGMEVYVRLSDGFISEIDRWRGQPTQDNRALVRARQARQIAMNLYPGTSVTDVDRSSGQGYRYFEVELSNGMEVDVHRATGEIIEADPISD